MDKLDRMFQLDRILHERRLPVPRRVLEERMECSPATVKRAIENLRNYLSTPIVYDRTRNGYYIDGDASEHEIPGLWFSEQEIHALLTMDRLLSRLEPGLMEVEIGPFRERLKSLLGKIEGPGRQIRRIRILAIGRRRPVSHHFPRAAHAVLQRNKMRIIYRSRSSDETSKRVISPQRLTHYRDNWYLDAWCHRRDALRIFSLDRIREAKVLDEAALDIDEEELDQSLASAFGIFSGPADRLAVLLFNEHRARWVAEEDWHSRQEGRWRADGRYELRIPYGNPTELIGDILKYGSDVEVLEPTDLRDAVRDEIREMSACYEKPPHGITK